MNYKGAFFFDVDGTLIDGVNGVFEPTKKTIEAVKKLKESGYLILISTGRPASMLDKRILKIEPSGLIVSNGTYVIIQGEEVLNHEIEKAEVKRLVEFLESHNIGYVLEGQDISYVDKNKERNVWSRLECFGLPMDPFTLDWELDNVKVHKLTVYIDSEEIEELLLNYSDEYSIMKHTGFPSADYYRNKYSKGYAIEELIEKLGIDRENTYAFGDGSNDIEMFQAVKYGIAMGGSPKELLAQSFMQTGSVVEEGIYEALKELKLI